MKMQASKTQNDFSKGPVWKCIVTQAVPLTIAQVVHLLYNVVDRVYLGHMKDVGSMALTGVGLAFPIITLIMAFTSLFGNGGVPLFSMARGGGEQEEAEKILGNAFGMLVISSGFLMLFSYLFCRPILFLFGASEASYPYAAEYLRIYLIGTVFTMLTTGLNGYINAMGFPRIGMMTTILGCVVNIILDPIFIFLFNMGVAGAALATVISQAISAIWVVRFLISETAPVSIKRTSVKLERKIVSGIARLGTANFIMQFNNCLVQIVCNSMLQTYGGDVYLGIMTVLNSVREIVSLPVSGIVSGGQPVVSFNYGAKAYDRVKSGIRFNTWAGSIYTLFAWILIVVFPGFWIRIFSSDPQMLELGVGAICIYFFGFVFMAFQFAGQSTFQALGDAKHAIFFSLLRKAVIVVPLTILLPFLGLGVNGVFLAEPISNIVGGLACYTTMRLTVYRKL